MRFEDFVLHLDSGTRGGFRARVLRSPFGEGVVGFSLPFAAILEPEVRSGATRDIIRKSLASASARPPTEIGSALFRSVFQGPVRMLLDKSRGRLELSPNLGLRIKIKIDPADDEAGALADLPWELLCDGETSDFFVLSRQMSVVRYLDVPRPSHPIPFTPPLRVLAVGASPRGLDELNLEEEERRLETLNRSSSGVLVRFLRKASIAAVREALSKDTYHVLHFMGHGSFDAESGEGMLAFELQDGSCDLVSGKVFAAMLQDLRSLGVVVLNACNTARARHQPNTDPFRGVASALVHGGIPAVVAMQQPISDRAAIGFSSAFYRLLACGASIDEALTDGRQALRTADPHGCEWATPVLFLRTSEGHVFRSTSEERTSSLPFIPPVQPPSRSALTFLAGAATATLLILAINVKTLALPGTAPQRSSSQGNVTYLTRQTTRTSSLFSINNIFQAFHRTFNIGQERSPAPQNIATSRRPNHRYSRVSRVSPGVSAHNRADWDKRTGEHRATPVHHAVLATSGTEPSEHLRLTHEIAASFIEPSGCLAYFQDNEGRISAVRDVANADNDEDWLGLRFTDFEGPRISLGILEFVESFSELEKGNYAHAVSGFTKSTQSLLATALDNTRRFEVIEPDRIREAYDRTTLRGLTNPNPDWIMNVGKSVEAQYLVYGRVTGLNLGSRGTSARIDFVLVDTNDGEILLNTSNSARIDRLPSIPSSTSETEATQQEQILGYALRVCVNKAAYQITAFLRNRNRDGLITELGSVDVNHFELAGQAGCP